MRITPRLTNSGMKFMMRKVDKVDGGDDDNMTYSEQFDVMF